MDASLLRLIREIDFDALTVAEAVAARSALKEGVEKSDSWFEKLAQGFQMKPAPRAPASEGPRGVTHTTGIPGDAGAAPRRTAPKRGRPPKVRPQAAKPNGPRAPTQDHPPIMSLGGG